MKIKKFTLLVIAMVTVFMSQAQTFDLKKADINDRAVNVDATAKFVSGGAFASKANVIGSGEFSSKAKIKQNNSFG